ncbi:probable LRR receptor-like serine/threonine-protein kinase At1g53420 [Impatiens glandulifera]|uniref:probable LRR receptor-like serine/threonine-protein kinase At1g53420 n=1 Tax=Impatiens glandulifera TaxID=253017 RepID=UPI001FB19D26|nr:probable LRR receptor-like serine/threonine-protein kinase At1g53420 [Impatiens glandulifera]
MFLKQKLLKCRLVQASGLEGPIPNVISALTNMKDLRISDINGPESLFPPISNLKNLEILILRSCNLIGPLPDYLSTMPLQTLLVDDDLHLFS